MKKIIFILMFVLIYTNINAQKTKKEDPIITKCRNYYKWTLKDPDSYKEYSATKKIVTEKFMLNKLLNEALDILETSKYRTADSVIIKLSIIIKLTQNKDLDLDSILFSIQNDYLNDRFGGNQDARFYYFDHGFSTDNFILKLAEIRRYYRNYLKNNTPIPIHYSVIFHYSATNSYGGREQNTVEIFYYPTTDKFTKNKFTEY